MAFNLDEYTPVSERIKAFWIDHPNGAIHSELVFDDGSRCVVKTVLWLDKDDSQPTTTDYAEEIITDRGVNATSRIENCCTSSQGRVLAAAGYLGADWTKKPSREEMQKVVRMSGDTQITESSNLASEKQRGPYTAGYDQHAGQCNASRHTDIGWQRRNGGDPAGSRGTSFVPPLHG